MIAVRVAWTGPCHNCNHTLAPCLCSDALGGVFWQRRYMEIQATGVDSSFIEGECETMFTDADFDQVSAWDASGRKDYIQVEASGQTEEEPLYMDVQPAN